MRTFHYDLANRFLKVRIDPPLPGDPAPDSQAITDGDRTRYQVSASGTCLGDRAPSPSVSTKVAPLVDPPVAGEVGLHIRNTQTTFESITVIESP